MKIHPRTLQTNCGAKFVTQISHKLDESTCSIRAFLPNSHQLGFALNVTRFLNSLSEDPSHPTYPHRGLMHAIYLWALRLSKDASMLAHEKLFLKRAINILQTAIGGGPGDFNDVR